MESFHTYPKIYSIGNSYLENLFHGPFQVEEKLDGSQFSFGHFEDSADPFAPMKIKCRSKSAEIDVDNPQKMFVPAVQWVKDRVRQLHIGWTYRAEWIPKPKANVLAYNRVPIDGLAIFDISTGLEHYLSYDEKKAECIRLGLECIPLLLYVREEGNDHLGINEYRALLQRESFLGGPKIEGVVIKNYTQFGHDGHAVFGKYVSEEFKEQHAKTPYARGPQSSLHHVIEYFKTPARWQKSVQHLTEAGKINNEVKDIGALFVEIKNDFESECIAECSSLLYITFKREILKGITNGVAEWYKQELAKKQFATEVPDAVIHFRVHGGGTCNSDGLLPSVASNGEGGQVHVLSATDGGSV